MLLAKERLVSIEVYEHFGWNVEDARQFQLSSEIMQTFQKLLFQRVMPNLKRIGLLTDSIRPKFEKLVFLSTKMMQVMLTLIGLIYQDHYSKKLQS